MIEQVHQIIIMLSIIAITLTCVFSCLIVIAGALWWRNFHGR